MFNAKVEVSDLQMKKGKYDGLLQYARIKRAQVELTEMFAVQAKDSGVKVHAMHPGYCETPGGSRQLCARQGAALVPSPSKSSQS